ncbi:MAG: transcriptional regulator with XRE-family HTH domain [Crocinitomix sp.]|jgi:transcriptional regulator with XRE-family HTH domain
MTKESVNQRFIEAINHLKNSPEKFKKGDIAAKIGISQNKLSEIMGKRMNVGTDSLSALSSIYNIDSKWLLTGEGDMIINEIQVVNEPKPAFDQHSVPLVSKYSYEKFKDYYDQPNFIEMLNTISWGNHHEINPKIDRAFEIRGDYMDDDSAFSFLDGDLVLTKGLEDPDWSKLSSSKSYYILLHREKGVLTCQVADYNAENKSITCHYLNASYDDFDLKIDDVLTTFKIIEVRREPRF